MLRGNASERREPCVDVLEALRVIQRSPGDKLLPEVEVERGAPLYVLSRLVARLQGVWIEGAVIPLVRYSVKM